MSWRALLAGTVCGILATLAVQAAIQDPNPSPAVPAPVARELRGIETTTVQCRPLVIYTQRAKRALVLPADIVADPARQVVAATRVPASDRSHTVSAVGNLTTGVVDLYVRPDPLPWLALERRTSFGVMYGVDDAGERQLRGTAQIDLLRSRNYHLGAAVHIDANGRALAGLVLSFR